MKDDLIGEMQQAQLSEHLGAVDHVLCTAFEWMLALDSLCLED